eukprot:jgi/Chrpa1/24806/Chrysochromulina_OHIO_Genome00004506-RA
MQTSATPTVALFTDDEAAAAIQSRIRGRHARAQTSHRAAQRASARIDDEPSIPFTADLAKQLAEAGGVGASANGMHVVCPRLVATGHKLAGSLRTALRGLPHLTAVDLSDNRLTSLAGLEALPLLNSLVCRNNRLMGVLDYRAPALGSRLSSADLRDNAIAGAVSLPPDAEGHAVGIEVHTQLETLLLDGNRLRSLRGVGAARRLRTFSAARNSIQDTSGLGPLTHLRALDLSANQLHACSELTELCTLRTLALHRNRLAALPDLTGLIELHSLTLASNQLLSLPALAEALTANTLKASMDTDGDGFIDATELLAWKAKAPAARALRSLTVANNPFLDRLLDARLRIIHAIPTLAILDEIDVTPEETVACKGLHGDDAAQLLAIRQRLFPDVNHMNSHNFENHPKLMFSYARQHSELWPKSHNLIPPLQGFSHAAELSAERIRKDTYGEELQRSPKPPRRTAERFAER